MSQAELFHKIMSRMGYTKHELVRNPYDGDDWCSCGDWTVSDGPHPNYGDDEDLTGDELWQRHLAEGWTANA